MESGPRAKDLVKELVVIRQRWSEVGFAQERLLNVI